MNHAEKRPYVSVVINNYNYGRYLGEAIESVLGQTLPEEEREIIVVDDGSTDDSRERLKKYGDQVRCIFKENGGQASALNAGVEKANGSVIAFLDSDDYWHPGKLQSVCNEFTRNGTTDFVYHFMNVIDRGYKVIDRFLFPQPLPGRDSVNGKDYLEVYMGGRLPWFSPTSGMTVRAECLKEALPIPPHFRIAADIYLHYVLPFYFRSVSVIREPLGFYRIHERNLSGGSGLTREKIERETGILQHIAEQVERHSGRLGVDDRLVRKRIDSLTEVYRLLGENVEGRKITALKHALLFDTSFPGDGMPARLSKKAALCASAVLPPGALLWLQRKYREGLYFLNRFRNA